MAHFVKLDKNNFVIDGCVVNNEALNPDNEESSGKEFLNQLFNDDARWIQTSFNARIRKNYAGIGFYYDEVRDAFIPPRCHDEAVLNEETCLWDCANADHQINTIS